MEEAFSLFPRSKTELRLEVLNRNDVQPSVLHLFDRIVDRSLALRNERLWNEHPVDCDRLERDAESVLNQIWENLHCGNWSEVSVAWRLLYSYASLCRMLALVYPPATKERALSALKACDLGLIMGAPILNGLLCRCADALNDHLVELSAAKKTKLAGTETTEDGPAPEAGEVDRPPLDPQRAVDVYHQPDLETFLTEIKNIKPAILTGVVDHWPAVTTSKWSLDYLRRVAGFRTVPVEIGSQYTDDSWSQSLTTVDRFIDDHILRSQTQGGERPATGYLAQYPLFEQIPRLRRDIDVPDYCYTGDDDDDGDVRVNAWFGPRGTVSPLHFDPDHNCLAQVVGAKYIRLYDASQDPASLYPHQGLLSNTSQVDVEGVDAQRFPLFAGAPWLECVLEAGSVLYLPPRWWHYVRSLSLSFSVSFWWK